MEPLKPQVNPQEVFAAIDRLTAMAHGDSLPSAVMVPDESPLNGVVANARKACKRKGKLSTKEMNFLRQGVSVE